MHIYRLGDPNGLTWAQSNGGPLLLLEQELLPFWNGVRSGESPGEYDPDSNCDYNRACAVGNYIGLLDVGTGAGLVLGDMPHMTAWWPLAAESKMTGMLVRWDYADGETEVIQALSQISDSVWEDSNTAFEVGDGLLHLFDSAYEGNEVNDKMSVSFQLQAGRYSVSTKSYYPDDRIGLVLHGFSRV